MINFTDLKKQYLSLKKDIDAAILQTLDEISFILGSQVSELEYKLANYVGVKHCVTCANGTDALSLVLSAYEIGPGDAVFVPTFTFFATAEVVSKCGAMPVFIDSYSDTFNIDCEKLLKEIKNIKNQNKFAPKAIIAVDLFGQPADYEKLEKIAKEENLLLIEDGAQGFGGAIKNRRCCSFGNIATTSFFPSKPLGCYGDGGAIFCNDDNMSEKLYSLRMHGKGQNKYDNIRIGVNSRLDTIQAAILLVKLKAFENFELAARQEVAACYDKGLGNNIIKPFVKENYSSSFAQYTIQLTDELQRNNLAQELQAIGIPTMVYYPTNMHQQSAYKNHNIKSIAGLEVAEKLCNTVLSLPMHPYLDKAQITKICDKINNILKKYGKKL